MIINPFFISFLQVHTASFYVYVRSTPSYRLKFTIHLAQSQYSLPCLIFIHPKNYRCVCRGKKLFESSLLVRRCQSSIGSKWRLQKASQHEKKPAKQLPNLITISGGRREKSFCYNSEGLKNGKLSFLFFLQLKKTIWFQLGY